MKYEIIAGNIDVVDKIKKYYRRKNGLLCCNSCEFGYAERYGVSNMRSHVESKHYSPGYHCSDCGKVFKLQTSLITHKSTTHVQNVQ